MGKVANLLVLFAIFCCGQCLEDDDELYNKAFTFFDCEDPGVKFSALDLKNVPMCERSSSNYEDPNQRRIAIVQKGSGMPVKAIQCNFRETTEIDRCGYDHLNYGVMKASFNKRPMLSAYMCKDFFKKERVQLAEIRKSFVLKRNSEQNLNFFVHGHRKSDGKCENAYFESHGHYYEKSVEQVFITAKMFELNGFHHVADDKIYFKELNLVGTFSNGYLEDDVHGMITWDTEDSVKCQSTVSHIYSGEANVYSLKDSNDSLSQAIVMLNLPSEERHAGFILKDKKDVCNLQNCFQTQLQDISICFLEEDQDISDDFKFLNSLENEKMDIRAQAQFLFMQFKMEYVRDVGEILDRICDIDRKLVQQKLQIIAANGNNGVYDLYGPGYRAVAKGAIAYIMTCVPVTARLAPYVKNCTNEIPIRYGKNGLSYADPISLTIKAHGSEVFCDEVMPVAWQLEKTWYCHTPNITRCKQVPKPLNITNMEAPKLDFGNVLNGAMFSKEQLEAHKNFVLAHNAREAVVNDEVNMAVINADEKGNLGITFNHNLMLSMKDFIQSKIVPFFDSFGTFVQTAGTVIGLICFFWFWICVFLRFASLIRHKGFGWHLLTCFCSLCFSLIYIPVKVSTVYTKKFVDEAMEGDHVRNEMRKIAENIPAPIMQRIHGSLQSSSNVPPPISVQTV